MRRASHLALVPLGAALALAACTHDTQIIGTACVASGTGDDLQAAIDTSSTVMLCPGAVITLVTAPLTLRQGLTLLTAGAPTEASEMATIRLGPDFPAGISAAVRGAGSDIHVSSIIFDGNRRVLGWRDSQILLELGPPGNYSVEHCVFTDSPGWTHLHLQEACDVAKITDNVVQRATRPHDDAGQWTDGMSISCAHSLIAGNRIDDISAVGIVYFGGPGTTIEGNVITETKTSAFSGINVGDAIVPDNKGVVVRDNQVIAKPPRYFSQGLSAGLHVIGKTTTVTGVSFLDNTFSGMARYGLAVDGCLNCTITGNDVTGWHPLTPVASCPAPAAYVAAKTAGHASGTLQGNFVDAKIDNCPGEAEALGPVYRMYAGAFNFPEYLAFEVETYSMRLEQKMDAAAMLTAEWDAIEARAKAICPTNAMPSDLQSVWRRLTEAQFGGPMTLSAADADAKVRADLTAAPAGTPCAPPI